MKMARVNLALHGEGFAKILSYSPLLGVAVITLYPRLLRAFTRSLDDHKKAGILRSRHMNEAVSWSGFTALPNFTLKRGLRLWRCRTKLCSACFYMQGKIANFAKNLEANRALEFLDDPCFARSAALVPRRLGKGVTWD